MAWSAISGPCTIWLFVRMILLSRRSFPPERCRTPSTPALMTCTHWSFFPARTSSGLMSPMKASASPISCITFLSVIGMTIALEEALCSSFNKSGSLLSRRIFFVSAENPNAQTASNRTRRRIDGASFLKWGLYRIGSRMSWAFRRPLGFPSVEGQKASAFGVGPSGSGQPTTEAVKKLKTSREGEAAAEPHGAGSCWSDGSPGGSPSQFFHSFPPVERICLAQQGQVVAPFGTDERLFHGKFAERNSLRYMYNSENLMGAKKSVGIASGQSMIDSPD